MAFEWSEERLTVLRRMFEAGASGGEIAREFGVTRNVIIGKLHRLGMKREATRERKKRDNLQSVRKVRVVKSSRPLPPPLVAPPAAPQEPEQLDLVEWLDGKGRAEPVEYLALTSYHCRALYDRRGSDGLMLSCGDKCLPGLSWCAAHARMFFAQKY